MAENERFSLAFPNGANRDFYLYQLNLSEGISELFRAELLILSKEPRSSADLKNLLGKRVSVTVTQRLSDSKNTRQRFLHGVITTSGHLGTLSATGKSDCYRYRLVVEPELATLRYSVHPRNFLKKNPVDVLEDILNQNKVSPAQIISKYINRNRIDRIAHYTQTPGETDLEFLNSILSAYGLSYLFHHPAAASGALRDSELFLSEGKQYPETTDIQYSDNRTVPGLITFDPFSADERQGIWRVNRVEVESRTGFDYEHVAAMYPGSSRTGRWVAENSNKKSLREWVDFSLFHSYEQTGSNQAIDEDMQQVLDAFRISHELEKFHCELHAENLLVTPGRLLQVQHFFGRKNSELLKLRVVRTTLEYRAYWPNDLANPPGLDENKDDLNIVAECMSYADDTPRRFCPPFQVK